MAHILRNTQTCKTISRRIFKNHNRTIIFKDSELEPQYLWTKENLGPDDLTTEFC